MFVIFTLRAELRSHAPKSQSPSHLLPAADLLGDIEPLLRWDAYSLLGKIGIGSPVREWISSGTHLPVTMTGHGDGAKSFLSRTRGYPSLEVDPTTNQPEVRFTRNGYDAYGWFQSEQPIEIPLSPGSNLGITVIFVGQMSEPILPHLSEHILSFSDGVYGENTIELYRPNIWSYNIAWNDMIGTGYCQTHNWGSMASFNTRQYQVFAMRVRSDWSYMSTISYWVNGQRNTNEARYTTRPESYGCQYISLPRTTTVNYLGKSVYAGDGYLDGSLRELVIYNRPLTDTELLIVSQVLLTKWAPRGTARAVHGACIIMICSMLDRQQTSSENAVNLTCHVQLP